MFISLIGNYYRLKVCEISRAKRSFGSFPLRSENNKAVANLQNERRGHMDVHNDYVIHFASLHVIGFSSRRWLSALIIWTDVIDVESQISINPLLSYFPTFFIRERYSTVTLDMMLPSSSLVNRLLFLSLLTAIACQLGMREIDPSPGSEKVNGPCGMSRKLLRCVDKSVKSSPELVTVRSIS